VKSKEPDWVGVPERVPPDDKVRPLGNPEAVQVKGGVNAPPLVVKVMAGE
jgi:hypothetical protein